MTRPVIVRPNLTHPGGPSSRSFPQSGAPVRSQRRARLAPSLWTEWGRAAITVSHPSGPDRERSVNAGSHPSATWLRAGLSRTR
jgi:hypothetical protein